MDIVIVNLYICKDNIQSILVRLELNDSYFFKTSIPYHVFIIYIELLVQDKKIKRSNEHYSNANRIQHTVQSAVVK